MREIRKKEKEREAEERKKKKLLREKEKQLMIQLNKEKGLKLIIEQQMLKELVDRDKTTQIQVKTLFQK